jgi:hypothetical protein
MDASDKESAVLDYFNPSHRTADRKSRPSPQFLVYSLVAIGFFVESVVLYNILPDERRVWRSPPSWWFELREITPAITYAMGICLAGLYVAIRLAMFHRMPSNGPGHPGAENLRCQTDSAVAKIIQTVAHMLAVTSGAYFLCVGPWLLLFHEPTLFNRHLILACEFIIAPLSLVGLTALRMAFQELQLRRRPH